MLTIAANALALTRWHGPHVLHRGHGASFGRMLIGLVLIGVLVWLFVRAVRRSN